MPQTATPTNRLQWTEAGQAPVDAQAAEYRAYVDGSTTPAVLANVTAVAAGADATCEADFPALVPGPHTLELAQVIGGVESVKSAPLDFTFVVVVTPTNLAVI